MTKAEALQNPDLQVNVTPAVEDAFYFIHSMENELPDPTDEEPLEEYEARLDALVLPGINAGNRLMEYPESERWQAIHEAYRMMDNLKKYGVACAEWV